VSDEAKNGKFDWRVVMVTVFLVVGQGLIQWVITYATLSDHSRRLDGIEKRAEERTVAREEYERRHEDMQKQLEQMRQEMHELERLIPRR
jgi:hypothetical protein